MSLNPQFELVIENKVKHEDHSGIWKIQYNKCTFIYVPVKTKYEMLTQIYINHMAVNIGSDRDFLNNTNWL